MTSTSRNNNNLYLFSDMNTYDNFSICSKNLNRLYKTRCFESFYQNLKNPKKCSLSDVYNDNVINLKQNTKMKNRTKVFSTQLVEDLLKSPNLITERKPKKIRKISPEEKEKEEEKKKRRQNIIEQNKKILEMSNTGKYHPNYDAIYPSVRSISLGKKFNNKKLPLIQHIKNKTEVPSDEILSAKVSKPKYDDNHVLRFSKYSSWKIKPKKNMTEANNEHLNTSKESHSLHMETNDNINNTSKMYFNTETNQIKSLKGIIDYNKMKGGRCFPEINKQNENIPTVGMYNPKYTYITKNTPTLPFKVERDKLHNKKYLLRKLWNSYEITRGYKLVHFNQSQSPIA